MKDKVTKDYLLSEMKEIGEEQEILNSRVVSLKSMLAKYVEEQRK